VKPYAGSVSVVEIPDVLASHAFDEAVKDVDYILHIASPLPDETLTGTDFDVNKTYIEPAIQGNIGILEAAQSSPTVKRVVITSSVAILAMKEGATTIGPDDLAPLPKVEDLVVNPWIAYGASKQLANAAADDFLQTRKPHYDVVHILPGYVQGRNEPVTSSRDLSQRPSSNLTMINLVRGVEVTQPQPIDLVLVDDVAAVHVAAMEAQDVRSGERFIASYPYPEPIEWSDVERVVRKLFPSEVESGILPFGGDGEVPSFSFHLDPSKTTERLGVKFHGLEDMVQSLIGQYVELVKKEKEEQN
jgi:nucleoside-diphosphate-sugar epimerase